MRKMTFGRKYQDGVQPPQQQQDPCAICEESQGQNQEACMACEEMQAQQQQAPAFRQGKGSGKCMTCPGANKSKYGGIVHFMK